MVQASIPLSAFKPLGSRFRIQYASNLSWHTAISLRAAYSSHSIKAAPQP